MENQEPKFDQKAFEEHQMLFSYYGVPVKINHREDFLKIIETLQRIGTTSYNTETQKKSLHQICYILHKRGKYSILHFKELYKLDRIHEIEISEEDVAIRNKISELLQEWNLLEIIDVDSTKNLRANISDIKILKNSEKTQWNLVSPYSIGEYKKNDDSML